MSKSVEELFKFAPKDATHARTHTSGIDFYKRDNGKWLYEHEGSWKLAIGTSEVNCVERPQPKPWSGPEDGLPPVGITCEALNGLHDQWRTVLILDHEGSVPTAACRDEENRLWWSQEFRAIKTPEQLAAESRETAIRELMDIAQVDCRVTAARLVDAGFKREGV